MGTHSPDAPHPLKTTEHRLVGGTGAFTFVGHVAIEMRHLCGHLIFQIAPAAAGISTNAILPAALKRFKLKNRLPLELLAVVEQIASRYDPFIAALYCS